MEYRKWKGGVMYDGRGCSIENRKGGVMYDGRGCSIENGKGRVNV